MTIAETEGTENIHRFIEISSRGLLVGLAVRTDAWYQWRRPGWNDANATYLKELAGDHDDFEGLAIILRINPETQEHTQ